MSSGVSRYRVTANLCVKHYSNRKNHQHQYDLEVLESNKLIAQKNEAARRAQISAGNKISQNRPEIKEAHRQRSLKLWADPIFKARREVSFNRPGFKAMHAAATKDAMARPEIRAYFTARTMQLCFNIRDFEEDPLAEGELRCEFSDNVLQQQCGQTNLRQRWGARGYCMIHYKFLQKTGALSADGTTVIYDQINMDDLDYNEVCVLCGEMCGGDCPCALCSEWCSGMCMGKEFSSDYTGDGPKKSAAVMFCAVDGCKEPRMPRIGFCPQHNQMSKSLLGITGITSPAKIRDKMSEMLAADLVVK
jgi:hypothetical protein